MAGNNQLVSGWLRPLEFPSIGSIPIATKMGVILFATESNPVDQTFFIQDLCSDYKPDYIESLRKRYKLLTTPKLAMVFVPNEKKILEKIIWPLKTAKKSFILNDYLGCIALCGVVSEMSLIFLFSVAINPNTERNYSIIEQKQLFGTTFEKLGQEKRLDWLAKLKLANEEFLLDAKMVQKIRRQYIHFLSKSYTRIQNDAEVVYKASFKLVKSLVDLPFGNDGRIIIPSHLSSYLRKKLHDRGA